MSVQTWPSSSRPPARGEATRRRPARGDPRALRHCLGQFTTGVTVLSTCRPDGSPHGLTVNSFASVSLEPPLVLFSVDRGTRASGYLRGRPFVINVLSDRQLCHARHFAGQPDPNLAITWQNSSTCPRLEGCIAYIQCAPWATYDGGDHVIHVGAVNSFEYRGGEPLVFHSGEFRSLGERLGDLDWGHMLTTHPAGGWLG